MISAPVHWPGLSLRRTLQRHIFAQQAPQRPKGGVLGSCDLFFVILLIDHSPLTIHD